MENLTHSLTGYALARAGLDRLSPHAAWLLVLSANIPDIDIVTLAAGPFAYFEAHRGYSHSLLAVPFLAAFIVLLVAAVGRCRLPWVRAWILCMIGVGSHLLLDATNSYGIRLWLPFSSSWSHLDLNGLFDIWILLILAFAAVWPLFTGLISREIGARRSSGRALAVFALVFFVVFDCTRATLHTRIVAQLESHLYNGAAPLGASALPDAFSPLRWTAVIETDDAYERFETHPFGEFNFATPQIFYKPAVTPAVAAAAEIEPFRYFLYFARFPVWSTEPVVGEHTRGTRLDLTDLRFGSPGQGSFHCIAYADVRGRILEKWLTYGPGTKLGWGPAH